MSVSPILPIEGVPDLLLKALNARFRSVSDSATVAAASLVPGLFFLEKNRPDANGTPVGVFGFATDTGTFEQVQVLGSTQLWVSLIGPKGAAVTTPAVSTSTISDTADGTYSANEVTMLGNLKTAVNQLNTDVANLKTAVDSLRARLMAYGVTS